MTEQEATYLQTSDYSPLYVVNGFIITRHKQKRVLTNENIQARLYAHLMYVKRTQNKHGKSMSNAHANLPRLHHPVEHCSSTYPRTMSFQERRAKRHTRQMQNPAQPIHMAN